LVPELRTAVGSTPTLRWRLNAKPIIHGVPESLLAAKIFFRSLYRDVAKEKLNLFQFATRIVTESSARPPEIMWRQSGNS
jgi:hypothetical protein